MTEKHTPTPWGIERTRDTLWVGPMRPDGIKVESIVFYLHCGPDYTEDANARAKANAEFIVNAVNSHTALVAALEPFAAYIKARDENEADISDDARLISYVTSFRGPAVSITYGEFRQALRALSAEGEKDAPKDDGWIEWKGGECPVEGGVGIRIECRLRDGSTDIAPLPFWRWSDEGAPDDIVAYRRAR